MAHARLSASAAHRWIPCPGSVALSAGIAETTSAHAAEGTLAHAWAAHKLDPVNNPAPVGPLSDEMAGHVSTYVDYCRSQTGFPYDAHVELDLTPGLRKLDPDCGGTADFVRYRPDTQHLLVVDLKYGAGVFVDVVGNPQLILYALGAALSLGRKVKSVTIAVVQPRAENEGGPVRTWDVPVSTLMDFAADVGEAAERSRDGDALLAPGEKQCRWCKAKSICPALEKQTHALVAADFTAVETYDPAKLQAALDLIPTVEARIKALRDFAYMELAGGRPVPGYKLVAKRATRKWADEAEAAKKLAQYGADVYEPQTLKSPAQVEKTLGKKVFAEHAALAPAVSSGYTLVSASDSRPAVALVSAADFPLLTSTETT